MEGTILSNRYLVAEEIGTGGMGNVYRATDLRTGGSVAVKVPHAFLARNADYVQRLRREAQIAASLTSPRVVRVIDLDTHEGLPFLVMEYVTGETLAEMLRTRGRFPLREAVQIALGVSRALEAAHARGIVHRDLKPQNIKLVDGEVKVLDFGIAKAEGFAAMTSQSAFIGTPEYCAPERGDGPGDIRSDIYSLGVILFELHEGRLPFQAMTPFGMMRKHETEPPPPLTGAVPDDVRAIVSACLMKDPAHRYQTPTDLTAALRRVLEGEPAVHHTGGTGSSLAAPTMVAGQIGAARPGTDAATVTRSAPAPAAIAERLPRQGSSGPLAALLVGILATIGALAVVAALVWRARGQANAVPSTSSTAVVAIASPTPTIVPTSAVAMSPGPSAGRPLLVLGERRQLATPPVELPILPCPGVKTVLQLRQIAADPDGRVRLGYTVVAPAATGVSCSIEYPADATCDCMILQTRLISGRVVEARGVGGSGISQTGAVDLYGVPEQSGEWWFDNVDLSGDEFTLVRLFRNSDAALFRIAVLRR